MNKITQKTLSITLLITLCVGYIHGCVVSFTNDSPSQIFVVNLNNNEAYLIGKDTTRKKIGEEHTKAHCQVFTKKTPRARSFNLSYEFKQHTCADNGNPVLKLSDLEKRTGETKLFNIKSYNQAVAQNTPSESTSHHGCSACGGH